MRRPVQIVLIALTIATGCAGAAQAQQYPNRPVRILVGFAAGSGPDIIARAVGQQLGSDLGHNFYVENRLGANGTIAAKAVADATPDGHTLLYSSAAISTTPYVYKKAGFDLLRDLRADRDCRHPRWLSDAGQSGELPVRTVPEFIAYAKANRVLYGSPGVGNLLHLDGRAVQRPQRSQDRACAVSGRVRGRHRTHARQHPRDVRQRATAALPLVEGRTTARHWLHRHESRSRTCRMCHWSARRFR